ncbi:MAG: hypothetical protein SOZ27_02470 [Spirochaetia bacterium]|nr:hypothetical protein [Spirochaetia bacterium]
MRNRIYILSLFLLFTSCDLLNPSKYVLTNDLNKDSVLDSIFSGKQILPPTSIDYYIEIDGADHLVTLFWEINPYASGYNIYFSEEQEGSFLKMNPKPIADNLYVLPPFSFSGQASEFHRYVKLTSVSESGIESAFSVISDITVRKESVFTGTMNSFSLTRGTSRNIEFSWTPAADAFRYEIYRKTNAASDEEWQCIDDCFIPYDNTVPMIVYKDLTAEDGVIYDYGVVAFDRYGARSEFSSVNIGYILPAPYDLEVVGLPSDGFTLTNETSILELTWKINSKLRNAQREFELGHDTELLGSGVFPFPEYSPAGWKFSALMEPGNPNFKDLYNVIFRPGFNYIDSSEHGLELLTEISEVNRKANPPDGFSEHADSLFYSRTNEQGIVTFKYRVEMKKPGSTESWYQYKWKKPVYFKVKAVYAHDDTVRRYETPETGLFGGYVTDSKGPQMAADPILGAVLNGDSVTITVTGIPIGRQFVNVFRRTAQDIQYGLVNADPLPVKNGSVSVIDSKTVLEQDFIDYRVEYAASDNTTSRLSNKVSVIITK